jgi:5-formyltetrahydrofolate cyclo-ligase
MASYDSSAEPPHTRDDIDERKRALRIDLRRRRRDRADKAGPAGREPSFPNEVAERLAWWAMVRGAGVAGAYASYGDEPSTAGLLDALRANSLRVLLPVMQPDGALQWSPYTGADDLVVNERGVSEPAGPRYGAHALGGVDLLIVPALAVDADGYRLGQGAGYYDRALLRLRPDVPVIALLHDDELLPAGSVPHDAHDIPVTHVCTPGGGLVAVGTHRSE